MANNGRYVPDHRPILGRYVPKEREETHTASEFISLTDMFQPKDQYDRTIIKEAVGGQDLLTEHIERLGRLIEARGEYVHFVKRKLDGEFCSCYNATTKEVRRKYCLECYGTRISGGYQYYKNTDHPDGKIIIAAPMTAASVEWQEWGRDLTEENKWWTLPWIPLTRGTTLQSYDFFIRFNEDGTELGRYYIVNVSPSRSMGNKVTYQTFEARLADRPTVDNTGAEVRRGDIVYEIDYLKDLEVLEGHHPIGGSTNG